MADDNTAKRTEPPHEPSEPPGRYFTGHSFVGGSVQTPWNVPFLERGIIESVNNLPASSETEESGDPRAAFCMRGLRRKGSANGFIPKFPAPSGTIGTGN